MDDLAADGIEERIEEPLVLDRLRQVQPAPFVQPLGVSLGSPLVGALEPLGDEMPEPVEHLAARPADEHRLVAGVGLGHDTAAPTGAGRHLDVLETDRTGGERVGREVHRPQRAPEPPAPVRDLAIPTGLRGHPRR